jgi:hypothetical protein
MVELLAEAERRAVDAGSASEGEMEVRADQRLFKKLHPNLVPRNDLDESDREKDRAPMRNEIY